MPIGAVITTCLMMLIPIVAIAGNYWMRAKKLDMERLKELNSMGRYSLSTPAEETLMRELQTLRQEQSQLKQQVLELATLLGQKTTLPQPQVLQVLESVPETVSVLSKPVVHMTDEAARRIAELAKRMEGGPPR
jgi:hypothetical protein